MAELRRMMHMPTMKATTLSLVTRMPMAAPISVPTIRQTGKTAHAGIPLYTASATTIASPMVPPLAKSILPWAMTNVMPTDMTMRMDDWVRMLRMFHMEVKFSPPVTTASSTRMRKPA